MLAKLIEAVNACPPAARPAIAATVASALPGLRLLLRQLENGAQCTDPESCLITAHHLRKRAEELVGKVASLSAPRRPA